MLSLTEIYKQIDTGDQGNYQVKAYERFLKWLHTHINTHRSIKTAAYSQGKCLTLTDEESDSILLQLNFTFKFIIYILH